MGKLDNSSCLHEGQLYYVSEISDSLPDISCQGKWTSTNSGHIARIFFLYYSGIQLSTFN